ncbi:MFS transporter [Methylobacterium sp. J-072]|uniref:MFS transporter n=1 Tax=Methylobacterium sp. J-072 TaxID=2836651 RepID=UPI001FB920C0|nr:MFS transporter [Methylobacterium sp. J-072]MCJ2096717.1 MFS transporter [Methylobacterium sp. J-072]
MAATSVSYVVVLLDTSIVNVALGGISSSIATDVAGLQWLMNAYTLAFASLLLTGGALGDRWAARNGYFAGLALFTLASTLCGAAASLPGLMAARAVQGVGAALLVPCSLKLINQAFPDPERRARAIGLWIGCGGLAMATGPLIGGILIDLFGWRSIFFVNLPIGLLGLAMTGRLTSEPGPRQARPFDLAGQMTAIIAIGTLIGVLIEGDGLGWFSMPTLAGLAIALAAGVLFLRIEARVAHPMLPLSLFRDSVFAGSVAVSFASAFVFYGFLFLISLYDQQHQRLSAVQTGLALLPVTVMVACGSFVSDRVARSYGTRRPVSIAFGLYAFGALGLLCTGSSSSWLTVPPMLAIGLASGFISPAATAPALSAVVPQYTGVAAAALHAARQTGAALGVAIFGALLAATDGFDRAMPVSLWIMVAVSLAAALIWRLSAGRFPALETKPAHAAALTPPRTGTS